MKLRPVNFFDRGDNAAWSFVCFYLFFLMFYVLHRPSVFPKRCQTLCYVFTPICSVKVKPLLFSICFVCALSFCVSLFLFVCLCLYIYKQRINMSELKSDSHLPKKIVVCFIKSPLKMMKNVFYFVLEALFVLKVFKFLSWHFGHVRKTAWLER